MLKVKPKHPSDTGTQTAITLGIEGTAARLERLKEAEISNSHEVSDNFKPLLEIPGTDTWTNYRE